MAVCETQVRGDNPENFNMPGYSLLPFFSPRRGLALYIRSDVAYQCQQQYNMSDPEFSAFWVKLKIQTRIVHFCFIYRSPNTSRDHTLSGLESISSSISSILAHHPQSEIVVAGDFNVHNTEWLVFSNHTSPEGLDVELFSNFNNLTELVESPTHFPCVAGQAINLLDLFLTSHPEQYEVKVIAPLGNSDHCTISAISPLESSPVSPAAPKRLVWLYDRADWEGLNNFFYQF